MTAQQLIEHLNDWPPDILVWGLRLRPMGKLFGYNVYVHPDVISSSWYALISDDKLLMGPKLYEKHFPKSSTLRGEE